MTTSAQTLELEQDLTFQRREWLVQRCGWLVWAGVIGAGLLGLMGPGPLSQRETASGDGRLHVKYDRFVHHHQARFLEVTMQPADESQAKLRLFVSQPFLDRTEVHRIEPEPTSRELTADGAWYEFRCQPGVASAKIIFRYECDEMGSGGGELQLAGSEPVLIEQFVYP